MENFLGNFGTAVVTFLCHCSLQTAYKTENIYSAGRKEKRKQGRISAKNDCSYYCVLFITTIMFQKKKINKKVLTSPHMYVDDLNIVFLEVC